LVFFFYLETYTNKSGYPVYQKGLCRHWKLCALCW
jgi:hypothetical protein